MPIVLDMYVICLLLSLLCCCCLFVYLFIPFSILCCCYIFVYHVNKSLVFVYHFNVKLCNTVSNFVTIFVITFDKIYTFRIKINLLIIFKKGFLFLFIWGYIHTYTYNWSLQPFIPDYDLVSYIIYVVIKNNFLCRDLEHIKNIKNE